MKVIDKRAKEYAKDSVQQQVFKDGWNAAMEYLAHLPFDKMLETFKKKLEERK